MTEISAFEERVAKALEALQQEPEQKVNPAQERTRIAELEDENEIVRERMGRLRNNKIELETKIDELSASLKASEDQSEGRHKEFLTLSEQFGSLELDKQKTENAMKAAAEEAEANMKAHQETRRKDLAEVDEILAKLTPLVEG